MLTTLNKAQRAGQRLIVGFDGIALDDTLKYYIDQIKVGGIILFSRNIDSPDQIGALCGHAQDYARQCGQPPLFIGIDQEGGVVARLKAPFTQFEGNPHMITKDDAAHFALTTARELKQIGVNMNMAPVLDVLPDKGESVMMDRAFGHEPKHVARMGKTVIDTFQKNHIMAVAKHFPGIGRTVLDSHFELPDLGTELDELAARDLVPFQSAIDTQVAGIMLSHIRYRSLDPEWPASLSPVIADDILRKKMGFQGLVLTDDLDMGAIAKHYDVEQIVHQCLAATVDILLICHPGPKIEQIRNQISNFQKNNEEDYHRKEAAAIERIAQHKRSFLGN
ncbi:MAG: beta-N-acetylhexosaminidase [Desulfobacteraceae bacterium]|jgi:beta-N-acetylhexosaminidase